MEGEREIYEEKLRSKEKNRISSLIKNFNI